MPETATLTLESEEKAILAIVSDDACEEYDVGVHYNNIVDGKLALKAGYRTTREYIDTLVEKARVLSQSSLSQFGTIARNFTREQADAVGTEVLSRFLTYRKLANYEPPSFEAAVVRVPGPSGKAFEKPLRDCTEDDMKAALRQLRGGTSPLSDEDAAEIEAYQAAVDSVLGADHPSAVKGRARRDETTVDFTGLPLKQVRQVCAAVQVAGPEPKPEDQQVVAMLADALEEARREGDADMALRARSRDGETLVTITDVPLAVFVKVLDELKRRANVVLR